MSSNKYPVTYTKFHKDPRDPSKVDHVEMHHANIDFGDNKPTTPERVKHLVANSPEHKALKAKGYTLDAYGSHKKPDNFYTYPVKITKQDGIDENLASGKSSGNPALKRNAVDAIMSNYNKKLISRETAERQLKSAGIVSDDEIKSILMSKKITELNQSDLKTSATKQLKMALRMYAADPTDPALKGWKVPGNVDELMKQHGIKKSEKITEDTNRIAQLQMATNQAKQITKAIKYDETVHDILVKIELLGEKYGIDKGQLEYAEDEVREAMSKLESAVYELDQVFAAALQDAEYAEEDANDVVDETIAVNRNDGPGRRWYDPEPAGSDEVNEYGAGQQSYRKFKPKVAGTFKKESSIMKGIQKEGKTK